jgi:hypothetical protein
VNSEGDVAGMAAMLLPRWLASAWIDAADSPKVAQTGVVQTSPIKALAVDNRMCFMTSPSMAAEICCSSIKTV